MNGRHRYTRKTIPPEIARTELWVSPDVSVLEPQKQLKFDRLKQAIEKYLGWSNMNGVLKELELSHEQLLRALERCTSRHEDGHLFGWRGLIKHVRVKEYQRTAPAIIRESRRRSGYAGSLHALFAQHPEIRSSIDHYLITRCQGDSLPESRVSIKSAHAYFIRLCDKERIAEHLWPYCVDRLGIGAIRNYVNRFQDLHYDQIAEAMYGTTAIAKAKTGTGYRSRLFGSFPYDIVELDEHKAGFIGSIGIPTPSGTTWIAIGRVTLIIAVCRHTSVVLGYHVIFRREARATDIMATLANALRPWVPREFSLPGLAYPEGAGFPSALDTRLGSCGWNTLLLDNALAHLAGDVIERAASLIGCAINYGAVQRFERRPIVELVFGRLSKAGFYRIPSTTGTGPEDPLRQQAEAKARKHRMSVQAVLDLIELVIADHNGAPSKRSYGIGGLDSIQEVLSDMNLGFIPPTLAPPLQTHPALDVVVELGKIGGKRASGTRPHIYLDDVPYTSPEIANRWSLIGTTVRKHIREDDIRTFEVFTEDGMPLGVVTAMRDWGRSSHSREARRQINALLRNGNLKRIRGRDPVIQWLDALQKKAVQKSKGNANTVSGDARALAEEERKRTVNQLQVAATDVPATSDVTDATPEVADYAIDIFSSAPDVYKGQPLDLATDIQSIN